MTFQSSSGGRIARPRCDDVPGGILAGGAPGTLGTSDNQSVPRASQQNSGSTASLPFVLNFLGRWYGKRNEECGSVFFRPEHSLQRLSRNERPASHPPIPIYGLNSALWGGTPEGAPSVPASCPEFRSRAGGTKRYERGRSERESCEPARPPITNGLWPQPLRQRRLPPGYRSDPPAGSPKAPVHPPGGRHRSPRGSPDADDQSLARDGTGRRPLVSFKSRPLLKCQNFSRFSCEDYLASGSWDLFS